MTRDYQDELDRAIEAARKAFDIVWDLAHDPEYLDIFGKAHERHLDDSCASLSVVIHTLGRAKKSHQLGRFS